MLKDDRDPRPLNLHMLPAQHEIGELGRRARNDIASFKRQRSALHLFQVRRPDQPVPSLERPALVVARRHLLEPAADAEPGGRLVAQRRLGRVVALLDLGFIERDRAEILRELEKSGVEMRRVL